MPPALGRFSTMIVWPRGLPIACAMTRATVSVGPPAAYGTSMVMALVGYCCASALVQNAIDAISDAMNEIRFIMGSGGEGAILRKGKVARPAGFEPTTLGFGGQYSDPLSYGRFQAKIIPLYQLQSQPNPRSRRMTAAEEHDEHSSFIKTPQQLIVVVLLSFIVPIVGIILVVQLVLHQPSADANATSPEAVAARLQPVGKVEVAAAASAPGARNGEEIYKSVCTACHQTGVANAPKLGDKAAWAPRLTAGLNGLVANASKGKGAMPPKGGAADLSDTELARAVVFMANQSGASFKEPAAAQKSAAKK